MTESLCGVTIEEQQYNLRAELPVNIREDARVARHPMAGWIVAYPQRNKPWRLPEWVRPGGSVETMDPGVVKSPPRPVEITRRDIAAQFMADIARKS